MPSCKSVNHAGIAENPHPIVITEDDMNRLVASGFAITQLLVAVPDATARPGVIIKGENGTKWCCPPPGTKGPNCEQGVSTLPQGKLCNFAGPKKISVVDPDAPVVQVGPPRSVIEGHHVTTPIPAPNPTVRAAPTKPESKPI